MKRILLFSAALLCTVGLCSCSDRKSDESSQGSPSPRVSTAPLDKELLGTWMNDYTGYRFGENRKVSLIVDFSENAHFTADGEFQTMNALIPKENIDYDGKRIYITNTAYSEEYSEDLTSVLIDMERLDGENPDSFDGYYHIYGGVATDVLAQQLGFAPQYLNFEAEIDGEKLTIYMIDCFDYEISDGKLDIFSDLLVYASPDDNALSYDYNIELDKLTMTFDGFDEVSTEVYYRVDE